MRTGTGHPLIDNIAAAILILDDKGVIKYANQDALDLLCFNNHQDILGRGFSDFLLGDKPDQFNQSYQMLIAENRTINLEHDLICGDETISPISITGTGVRDDSGVIAESIITLNKISTSDQGMAALSQSDELDDLKWLADQGRNLLKIDSWEDILDIAGHDLQKKLDDCIVVALTKLDEDTLRLDGIHGINNNLLSTAWRIIGGSFHGRLFPIDERFREVYAKRKLLMHSGGLNEIANSQLPEEMSRRLEKMVGVKSVYTIGLEGNRQVMGCIYLFSLGPNLLQRANLIESFTFQVALALEKAKYAHELKVSETQFKTIFEYAPDGYYLSDLQGNFIDGNLEAERIIGYSRDQMIGKNFLNVGLISKDQIPKAGKLLAQSLLGKSTGPDIFYLNRSDGRLIQAEVSTHPVKLGEKSVILGIARDISDRKQAEENLESAHQSLTRVLEGIDAHVYVADFDTYEILYMNKSMIEDFGGDFTGQICHQVFRGEKNKCSACSNPRLLNELGEPGEVVVWENQNRKTEKWYRNYDRAIYWTDQRLVRMQIAVDITDTILASKEIEISEKRYRNLFEASHNALMTVAPPDWTFMSGNPAVIKMFKMDDEAHFLSFQPWQLSPEYQPDGQRSDKKAQEMIGTAVDQGSHFFHWTHKRSDGEEFPATVQLTRVDLEDDFIIQATVRDIADQVKADQILRQQMDDLALLNDLNVSANQGKNLDEILAHVSRETERLFNSRTTTVYLLSEDENHLQVNLQYLDNLLLSRVEKLTGITWPEHLEIPIRDGSLFRRLLDSGEVELLSSKEEIIELVNEYLTSTFLSEKVSSGLKKLIPKIYKIIGIKSLVFAPLMSAGKPIGFIDMSSSRIFSNDEMIRFKSFADQLSGFIQKINAEKERTNKLKELELINHAFVEGSRLEDVDEICDHLADLVGEINPNAYVIVTLIDPEVDAIRIRAIRGIQSIGDRIIKILGKKPEDVLISISDAPLDEDLNNLFTSGKLERIPGGLYDLTRGVIPQRICKSIERIAGITDVYIAGFGLRGESTGGLVIMVKEGQQVQFPGAIESIANHLAGIFERRMAQDEISKHRAQLEALREIELEIANNLDREDLLSTIALKACDIVDASATGFGIYNPHKNVLEYLAYTGFEELPKVTDIKYGEGLAGKVWQKGEIITIENYAEWEGRSKNWEDVGNYYLAGIPVIWGEELLGVLEIAKEPYDGLTPSELRMIELFATQAAIAIKNSQLYSEEKQRRTEAEALREGGMIINRMMDRPELLDLILSALKKVVPFVSASVQLVQGQNLVVEAYQGPGSVSEIVGTEFNIPDDRLAKVALHEGKHAILANREEIAEAFTGPGTEMIQSSMTIPIEIKGNRIGLLSIDHDQPNQYSDQDAILAMDYANQAAIALENNQLFNEIRRRTQEIEVVYESALILTQELRPDTLFEYLNIQIDTLFSPDAFILATYDGQTDLIKLEYSTEGGEKQRQVEGVLIPASEKNSLLTWIIRKKTPLLIGNVETDSLPVQPRQAGKTIRSWLGVPLLIGDRLLGALVVQSYEANAYTQDHRRLLQLLGNQAAVALENSRLFEDAQRRLLRLSSLREIDQAVSGSVDLEMTMDVLIDQLISTLEVDAACVLAYRSTTQTLEYVTAQGFKTSSLQFTSLKIGDGLAGRAALDRSMVHIPNLGVQKTSFAKSPHFEREGFVTYLAYPLVAKGELVGVLEVFHRSELNPDPEWISFLESLGRVAAIAIDRLNLYNGLAKSNIEIKQAYDATIEGWARAIELRDGDTEGHSRRVVSLVMNLARTMGFNEEQLAHMRRGALLHDIGKMAVPDGILLKTGKLTDEEWTIMKIHPVNAYEMLSKIDYLKPALDIPYSHHEKWDGSGYPQGLAGEEIPLAARIFAVIDVWDALQSDRPYRKAWPVEKVKKYIKEQTGTQFDPMVVDAFFKLIDKS